MKVAHGAFSTYVERIEQGARFENGQVRTDVLHRYKAAVVLVDKSYYSEYLGSAIGFYDGTHLPALQIVWPDKEDRFPWEGGYAAASVASQVVLNMTA